MYHFVRFVFSAAVLASSIPVSAATPPPARTPFEPVPKNIPGANTDHGQFTHNNEDYRYTIMSLWARDPNKPNALCLRYDIRNEGDKLIELLDWEDIGIYSADVEPKKPASHVRTGETRHDHAEVGDTELKAFRGTSYKNRAFFTEEQISRRPAKETMYEDQQSPTFAIAENYIADFEYNTKTGMPALAAAFSSNGFDVKTSISLQPPKEQVIYSD